MLSFLRRVGPWLAVVALVLAGAWAWPRLQVAGAVLILGAVVGACWLVWGKQGVPKSIPHEARPAAQAAHKTHLRDLQAIAEAGKDPLPSRRAKKLRALKERIDKSRVDPRLKARGLLVLAFCLVPALASAEPVPIPTPPRVVVVTPTPTPAVDWHLEAKRSAGCARTLDLLDEAEDRVADLRMDLDDEKADHREAVYHGYFIAGVAVVVGVALGLMAASLTPEPHTTVITPAK